MIFHKALLKGILGLLLMVAPAFALAGKQADAFPPPPVGAWGGGPMGPGMGGPMGPGMGGPGGLGMGGPEHMLDPLDLNPVQKARLKDLRRARRERLQKLMNALNDAREDFEDLLNSGDQGPGFEKRIRANHAKMVALQQSLDGELFESILEIRGLLSPAQLKKFNQMHKAMARCGPGKPRALSGTAGD